MGSFQRTLFWLALLGAEVFVLAGYACLQQMFANIQYIETELRREISRFVSPHEFWMYENWLGDQRGLGALAFESWPTVAVLIGIVLVYGHARPTNALDAMLFAIDALLFVGIAFANRAVTKIRRARFRVPPTAKLTWAQR